MNSCMATGDSSARTDSPKSTRSLPSTRSRSAHSGRSTEETPLLSREDRSDHGEQDLDEPTPATTSLLRSLIPYPRASGKRPASETRWPSIFALLTLSLIIFLIMLGFFAVEGVEEYILQAADVQTSSLALDSLTDHGAKVHLEGLFKLDAGRVNKPFIRNLGRFTTWLANEVQTGPTLVDISLPEYGNVVVGKVNLPGMAFNIRNQQVTHISITATLEPGPLDGIRFIATDWIEGRIRQLRFVSKATTFLKSRSISIGKHTIEQSFIFRSSDLPMLPHYNITKLNLHEAPHGHKGMSADASIVVLNKFPIQLQLPPTVVDVLIGGCSPSDDLIMVGNAKAKQLEIKPKTDVQIAVQGNIEKLSNSLVELCPNSAKSPLDSFLGDYMKGADATVYINCCQFPDQSAPRWTRDLLRNISFPVPFTGRDMGELIKNFSLSDVHFYLPDPSAEPGTYEAAPKISAVVKVFIRLPEEMNFPLSVNQVKANAYIYYHHKKLGTMNVEHWQKANSTRIEGSNGKGPTLFVQSYIEKAPVEIADDDLFAEVVQALLFGSKPIVMNVKAGVSVGVDTPLGKFAVRDIPTEGVIPVKPIQGDTDGGAGDAKDGIDKLNSLKLKIGNLSIVDTSSTSISIDALVNVTNPTNYSATVPYLSINILVNGTHLGQAVVRHIEIRPGINTGILISAVWDPYTLAGDRGKMVGRELLSKYVSGFNTSLTIRAHKGTIPALPALGLILSRYPITIPTRLLSAPRNPNDDENSPSEPEDPGNGGDDDHRPRFIREATMHLISSTAVFTLASPFTATTFYITSLNATAYYEGHPSGQIIYDLPFAILPGLSETPRLPVDWSLGSVGYEAIRKALGGKLKVSAFAYVGIRIGEWREQIWFRGGAIGANVKL